MEKLGNMHVHLVYTYFYLSVCRSCFKRNKRFFLMIFLEFSLIFNMLSFFIVIRTEHLLYNSLCLFVISMSFWGILLMDVVILVNFDIKQWTILYNSVFSIYAVTQKLLVFVRHRISKSKNRWNDLALNRPNSIKRVTLQFKSRLYLRWREDDLYP